jgi:hypothetical protein
MSTLRSSAVRHPPKTTEDGTAFGLSAVRHGQVHHGVKKRKKQLQKPHLADRVSGLKAKIYAISCKKSDDN